LDICVLSCWTVEFPLPIRGSQWYLKFDPLSKNPVNSRLPPACLPVNIICEPLKAVESALSGSVLLSVFQLLAIPEFDCDPNSDPDKWSLCSADSCLPGIVGGSQRIRAKSPIKLPTHVAQGLCRFTRTHLLGAESCRRLKRISMGSMTGI